MQRRSFLRTVTAAAPAAALAKLALASPAPAAAGELHSVQAGQDRLGKLHSLGVSQLAFKVTPEETDGNLFVIEHRNLVPGGPPLHMHLEQEEWFYVMEGRVTFVVGHQRLTLGPGESVLAPRRVPHTFSSVVPSSHLLIAFTPACKMPQYFIDANGDAALAAKPEFMNRYDMQWSGRRRFARASA